jgi:hypothetical protein
MKTTPEEKRREKAMILTLVNELEKLSTPSKKNEQDEKQRLEIEQNKRAILDKYENPENFERAFSPSKFCFSRICFKDKSNLVVVMTMTQRDYFFKSKLCLFAFSIAGLGYAKPLKN